VAADWNLRLGGFELDRNHKFDIESTAKADNIDCRRKEQSLQIAMGSELDREKGFDAWLLSEFEQLEIDRYRMSDTESLSMALSIRYIQ
jgi:hypothetical protein